ncbi:unnamed protein product [Effrenium voratum]|nr:unnamed protein product [Effrenium voratum]
MGQQVDPANANSGAFGLLAQAHTFLKENNCDVEMEKLTRAFGACKSSGGEPAKVTREEFARLIRVVYEVVRDVGITETLSLGPPMRPLALGELVEVQAGPKAEPSEGLQRIHARAQLDGALGWVTLSSSEGPYLARSKAAA